MEMQFETLNLKELKLEAQKLQIPFASKVLKATLLALVLAAHNAAKDHQQLQDRAKLDEILAAKVLADARLKEQERDAEECARLSAILEAHAENQESGWHDVEDGQQPPYAKSKKTKKRTKKQKRAHEDDRDELPTEVDNPAKAACRPSLTWGDVLEDGNDLLEDLETRLFATSGSIQSPKRGEPSMADRGFEVTVHLEPGDFVVALRVLPGHALTWPELQQTWLDFYKVQRVTTSGTQVMFAQSMGPTREVADPGPSAPEFIRGGGEVLRAIGGLFRRLQSAPETKTADSDGMGHKNCFYDAVTGNILRYTDKTNVAARVPASRVMRRLSTREVLDSLMEDDVYFDGTKAWSKLVREATIRQELHRPGTSAGGRLAVYKWSAIQRLPVTKRGQDYFLKMADGAWDEISLSSFSDISLSTSNNNSDKMALAGALENVGRFFTFCHGGSWDSIVQPFVVRIREDDWSEDTWEASFLRNELEGVFRLFFHVLHGTSTAACRHEHGGELGTPATVGDWLGQLLENLVPEEGRQNWFIRRQAPPTVKESSRSTVPKTSAPVLSKPGGSRGTSGQPTNTLSAGASGTRQTSRPDTGDRFCRYHFLHALGVQNMNGAPYRACTESHCRYHHPNVDKMDKSKIGEMAQTLIAIPGFGQKIKSQLERSLAARK